MSRRRRMNGVHGSRTFDDPTGCTGGWYCLPLHARHHRQGAAGRERRIRGSTRPAIHGYLPTAYDPSRPAPILYLMDPRGRARVAAKLFQPAAERFGYILVSSHNTGSDVAAEVNLQAMQAMWIDSHDWFSIDKRVYVAGFSGTARLASLMARHLPTSITGIIGSAAAYHPDVRPSRESAFLFRASGDTLDPLTVDRPPPSNLPLR